MAKTKKKNAKVGVSTLLQNIVSQLGGEDGAQLLGGDGSAIEINGVLSTQIPGVDDIIGRGGIPYNRLTLIHGGEAGGKTTLALQLAAQCQRDGGIVVYMDMEYKLDKLYAMKLGVDVNNMIGVQPPHLQKVFSTIEIILDKLIGSDAPVLIVLDSINACQSKAEYEGDFESVHVSPLARAMSQGLPRIIRRINKHKQKIALVFLSQIREKIGVSYGKKTDTAAGKAPKFYATLMLEVIKYASNKKNDEKVANRVRIECSKNQIAPPYKVAKCILNYGYGFDKEHSLLVTAEKYKIVKKSGSHYSYGEQKIGNGVEAAAKVLKDSPKLYEKILAKLRKKRKW